MFNNSKNLQMNQLRDNIAKEESVAEILPKTSVMFDVRRVSLSKRLSKRDRCHNLTIHQCDFESGCGGWLCVCVCGCVGK